MNLACHHLFTKKQIKGIGSVEKGVVGMILGLTLTLAGCAETIYPITTGYHIPAAPKTQQTPTRVVIWSNHPGVEKAVADGVVQSGRTVVARARLEEVLNKRTPTAATIEEAEIVAAAKQLGIDRVYIAEVTLKSAASDEKGYYLTDKGAYYGGPIFSGSYMSGSAFYISVMVRSIEVATGKLRWLGSATYPRPITSPEKGVVSLTQLAISHAKCLIAVGFEWKELDESGGGCVLKK